MYTNASKILSSDWCFRVDKRIGHILHACRSWKSIGKTMGPALRGSSGILGMIQQPCIEKIHGERILKVSYQRQDTAEAPSSCHFLSLCRPSLFPGPSCLCFVPAGQDSSASPSDPSMRLATPGSMEELPNMFRAFSPRALAASERVSMVASVVISMRCSDSSMVLWLMSRVTCIRGICMKTELAHSTCQHTVNGTIHTCRKEA